MRLAILCFVLTLVGCTAAPEPKPKKIPESRVAVEPEKVIPPEATTPVAPAPAAPAAETMDMASLKPQVEAVYTQNPKLSAAQAEGLSDTTMQLIEASKAGDQKAISGLSSQLLNQALLGRSAFGLVDAGGLANAIQDLVAAAINADVAGILDAVEDIVAAVTA